MQYDGSRDRWEIDGDCELCRRQSYCSKPCKMAERRQQYIMQRCIMQGMAKLLLAPSKKE